MKRLFWDTLEVAIHMVIFTGLLWLCCYGIALKMGLAT